MKILVACEESQRVTAAFRSKGHEAWSCDLLPTSGSHPEWHIIDDVVNQLLKEWDMIIAFPPCTYLSKAGARWMYVNGSIDLVRHQAMIHSKNLFMEIWNHSCTKICIENPVPMKIVGLPKHTQSLQPFEFGHPYSKKTYLWLKGLPVLMPTDIVNDYVPYLPSNTGGKKRNQSSSSGMAHDRITRSKTFDGIAAAMADQWSYLNT